MNFIEQFVNLTASEPHRDSIRETNSQAPRRIPAQGRHRNPAE